MLHNTPDIYRFAYSDNAANAAFKQANGQLVNRTTGRADVPILNI